jgi:hypothetical protein
MIRSINGFGQFNGLNNSFTNSEWQITFSSRYYSSNKNHFEGKDYTPAKENQTDNSVFTAEMTVTRLLKNGWSLDLTIPYTDGSRTSNQEHGGLNTTPAIQRVQLVLGTFVLWHVNGYCLRT